MKETGKISFTVAAPGSPGDRRLSYAASAPSGRGAVECRVGPLAAFALEGLHALDGGKQLADGVGQFRMTEGVFLEGGLFAAPEAGGEFGQERVELLGLQFYHIHLRVTLGSLEPRLPAPFAGTLY